MKMVLKMTKLKGNAKAAMAKAELKNKAAKKVKLAAKMEKMRTQENLVKKRRVLKDPAQKRLRKQQRRAAREVRGTTQHLTRVARRMNRAAKYSIRQMRAHVVERVHEQEKLAAEVV